MDNLLKSAIWYLDNGFSVIPVKRDKTPLLKWDEFARRYASKDEIKSWWAKWPDAQIALVCGKISGITVVDADSTESFKNLQKQFISDSVLIPTVKTSKGFHLYFKYNPEIQIGNKTRFFEDCDIRSDRGYVLAPPSCNAKGSYSWIPGLKISDTKPPEIPEKLLKAIVNPQPKPTAKNTVNFGNNKSYGEAALRKELEDLAHAGVGQRNDTLNRAAYSLGQLVAGGELDYSNTESALLATALAIGLKENETRKTIESGLKAGALEPRCGNNNGLTNRDVEEFTRRHLTTVTTPDDTCRHLTTEDDTCRHLDDNLTTLDDNLTAKNGAKASYKDYTLAERIFNWVVNSPGSFTNNDIDREFCLTTREEKKNRSKILERLYGKVYIKKEKRRKGYWYVVDKSLNVVDLDADEPSAFKIKLPFNIHDFVNIPPKAIILLAGSSNAGKTAFILNTLRMNIEQDYKKFYLMSEMGGAEYKTRICGFGDPISNWKKIIAAERGYDFDGAITHYNPDGLTCIDYLEEVDGEYQKIPTDIRNIYDSIKNGVAIIAIQKRTDQEFARGGQGTVEKARLVMNLDYLATGDQCIYCSLKLVKVKHFLNRNLQGHEIHFKLERGCWITPITDWMLSSRVNRKKYISQYESGNDNPNGADLFVRTIEGSSKRIAARDIAKWQESMHNIDVYSEISKIANKSLRDPFLKEKGYFFQLATILKNMDEK